MKKEYVKPVMEGEAFVANEYVATCWTVSCLECGASDEGYDTMKNNYINNATPFSDNVYMYTESINGKTPCRLSTSSSIPNWVSEWGFLGYVIWRIMKEFGAKEETTETYYHTIQAVDHWTVTTNHPNASV